MSGMLSRMSRYLFFFKIKVRERVPRLNFRTIQNFVGKRVRLGLQGKMSGCLKLFSEIKGRARVTWLHARTSHKFLLERG